MPTEDLLLRHRLMDNLVDDGEYLDELYNGCNSRLEDTGELPMKRRFRLGEIVMELRALTDMGLVKTYTDTEWPEHLGVVRVIFSLAHVGLAYWRAHIKVLDRDELYV